MSRQGCGCGATFERTTRDLSDVVAEKRWGKLHALCAARTEALTLTPSVTPPQVQSGDTVRLIVGEKTWIGIYPDGPWEERS